MRRAIVFLSLLGLLPAQAHAQEWQIQNNDDQDLRAALVLWSSGHVLVARCQTSYFEVYLRLPEQIDSSTTAEMIFEGQSRRVALQPQIGRQRSEILFTVEPARAGRWLMGGGELTVEAPGMETVVLPLPRDAAPMREVMSACETPLEDARDLLPRLPSGPRWAVRPAPSWPSRAHEGVTRGTVSLTCVAAADGSVRDCVVEREDPVENGFGREALRAVRSARLAPSEEGILEGAVVSFSIRYQLGD